MAERERRMKGRERIGLKGLVVAEASPVRYRRKRGPDGGVPGPPQAESCGVGEGYHQAGLDVSTHLGTHLAPFGKKGRGNVTTLVLLYLL